MYYVGPEYLRKQRPLVIEGSVQQDAVSYARAGKGRGGNRSPNAAANWIALQLGLNEAGQRALHDEITGMEYTLDQIRDIAEDLSQHNKYLRDPPQEEDDKQ